MEVKALAVVAVLDQRVVVLEAMVVCQVVDQAVTAIPTLVIMAVLAVLVALVVGAVEVKAKINAQQEVVTLVALDE
jgi:hypothetical protein